MGTLTMVMQDDFIKQLDQAIKESKMYSSRSEFLKDAVRAKLKELEENKEKIKKMHEATRQIGLSALKKGWNGELPTREHREKIFEEFIKEKGWKI